MNQEDREYQAAMARLAAVKAATHPTPISEERRQNQLQANQDRRVWTPRR